MPSTIKTPTIKPRNTPLCQVKQRNFLEILLIVKECFDTTNAPFSRAFLRLKRLYLQAFADLCIAIALLVYMCMPVVSPVVHNVDGITGSFGLAFG
jgi:hypothetical protein